MITINFVPAINEPLQFPQSSSPPWLRLVVRPAMTHIRSLCVGPCRPMTASTFRPFTSRAHPWKLVVKMPVTESAGLSDTPWSMVWHLTHSITAVWRAALKDSRWLLYFLQRGRFSPSLRVSTNSYMVCAVYHYLHALVRDSQSMQCINFCMYMYM